jgi:hypothetical protein
MANEQHDRLSELFERAIELSPDFTPGVLRWHAGGEEYHGV